MDITYIRQQLDKHENRFRYIHDKIRKRIADTSTKCNSVRLSNNLINLIHKHNTLRDRFKKCNNITYPQLFTSPEFQNHLENVDFIYNILQ